MNRYVNILTINKYYITITVTLIFSPLVYVALICPVADVSYAFHQLVLG